MAAKGKGKLKKIGGVLLAIAGAFMLFRYGQPEARFKRDAQNSSTAWGLEIKNYLGDRYSNQAASGVAKYHMENNTQQWQKYVSKGWAIKQA